jgi:hypothetical protein
LHKHDTEEVEKAEVVKDESPESLPIPGNISRSGSRKYSVCEGIESPTLISPFGSRHESRDEDDLQHSERRRSRNFGRVPSRSSSLRGGRDYEEEYMDASDVYRDLPGKDTAKDIQGDAHISFVVVVKLEDKTVPP